MRRWCFGLLVATVVSGVGPAVAGDPIAGKRVWETNSCPSCHGVDGRPVVPGVPDFSKGDSMIKPDSRLIESIAKGGRIMPAFRGLLKPQQMIDVVVYIRTLRRR